MDDIKFYSLTGKLKGSAHQDILCTWPPVSRIGSTKPEKNMGIGFQHGCLLHRISPERMMLGLPPQETNMTMENQPVEDVSPTKNWELSIVLLVFRGV